MIIPYWLHVGYETLGGWKRPSLKTLVDPDGKQYDVPDERLSECDHRLKINGEVA